MPSFDYSRLDPLEFLRVMQDHRSPMQPGANPAPQPAAPPPMQDPTQMQRMAPAGGGMASFLGPAHQALMSALASAQNPQANIAAMTADPSLASQINGQSPRITPQNIPTATRVQWPGYGAAARAAQAAAPPPVAQPEAPKTWTDFGSYNNTAGP